jgi:hypothetical protein
MNYPANPHAQASHAHPGAAPPAHAQQAAVHPAAGQNMQVHSPAPAVVAKQPKRDKNFFEALFDFKFDYFVTAKVMKVIYGLMLLAIVLAFGAAEIEAIDHLDSQYGSDEAWMMMLGAPFMVPIAAIVARIYCEMLVVFVRMAEHLREIAGKAG